MSGILGDEISRLNAAKPNVLLQELWQRRPRPNVDEGVESWVEKVGQTKCADLSATDVAFALEHGVHPPTFRDIAIERLEGPPPLSPTVVLLIRSLLAAPRDQWKNAPRLLKRIEALVKQLKNNACTGEPSALNRAIAGAEAWVASGTFVEPPIAVAQCTGPLLGASRFELHPGQILFLGDAPCCEIYVGPLNPRGGVRFQIEVGDLGIQGFGFDPGWLPAGWKPFESCELRQGVSLQIGPAVVRLAAG